MKNLSIFLIILTISITNLFSQVPESFKYQAVIRDGYGNVLSNQTVGLQFSILQNTTAIYTEIFTNTTNEFGLINLNIGEGTVVSGDFSTIDWGADTYFLKVEIDVTGGTNYSELSTSKLNSVPYALYAKNTNDADADPTNELQILNFSNDTLYLSDGGQIYMGAYGNLWATHGNDIYNTNSQNVGVGLENPTGKLVVQGDSAVSDTLPLFEVKNKDGITVFAVYDGGVRVYVNDDPAKANNDKSGFAIGGYRLDKSITNEYMRVTPDSVRVYIKEENTNKDNNKKGGFAIGGYRLDKTLPDEYLNVYAADTAYVLDTTSQMLWYPLKEAFLSGKILVEDADSVGQNSWATGYVSKSIGDYSQALGYQARAFGNNSTAIGYYANAIGNNSYAFGNYSTAIDSGSYAIGSGAKASGLRSFAFGSTGIDSVGTPTAPTMATGDYSYAFGMGSVANNLGSFAFGTQDTAHGEFSLAMGYKTIATGYRSTAIGIYSAASANYSTAIGFITKASGGNSTAMGVSTTASGINSTSLGNHTTASGSGSTAIGVSTTASGSYSTTLGNNTTATGNYGSTAMGYNTTASGSYGSVAMGDNATASGISSIAMGDHTLASGDNSTVSGNYTTASGDYAIAIGRHSTATGNSSTAFGNYTTANGISSTAIGSETKAIGNNSMSIGNMTSANGNGSVAMGFKTIAKSYIETVIGRYNDTTISINQTSWSSTDPLFIIGNGTDYINRHNAVTVLKNGNVGIGTSTPNYNMEIVATGATMSLNSLEISDLGNDNLGLDGDIVPFNSTSYDIGNNVTTEHWDEVCANTFTTFSDKRLKTNIQDLNYGLDAIMSLRPVSYKYIEKVDISGKTRLGLIAQEVEVIIPNVVINDDVDADPKTGRKIITTNEYKALNYIDLIPVLIKAIQEQEQKINKLENENKALNIKLLKQQNDVLKAELEQIKQILEIKAQK